MSFSIAWRPSEFNGTARDNSPPLTIFLSNTKSRTGFSFCHTSLTLSESSSEIRPPVDTPMINRHRFRSVQTHPQSVFLPREFQSLSKGLVPFITFLLIIVVGFGSALFRACHRHHLIPNQTGLHYIVFTLPFFAFLNSEVGTYSIHDKNSLIQ